MIIKKTYSSFLFLVFSVCLLFFLSCQEPPNDNIDTTITLSLDYAYLREVWLKVSVEDPFSGWAFILNRDGESVMTVTMERQDTVVVDSGLTPATLYTYRAYRLEGETVVDSSGVVTVKTEDDKNLLINSSFEINGKPSLEGWFIQDTLFITFENNTPPDGGNWSISLEANWGPPFSISSTVMAKQGTYKYNFSLWSKAVGVGGSAYLNLKQADTLVVKKSISISDTSWTFYSILDTISMIESDSIVVTLTGGFSHLFYGKTYFDLCKLEIID